MSGSGLTRSRAIALALAGLLAAAGLGAAASQITSQQVGLSGQPVSVSEELVAGGSDKQQRPRKDRARTDRGRDRTGAGEGSPATPAPTAAPPEPASTTTGQELDDSPQTGGEAELDEAEEEPDEDDD